MRAVRLRHSSLRRGPGPPPSAAFQHRAARSSPDTRLDPTTAAPTPGCGRHRIHTPTTQPASAPTTSDVQNPQVTTMPSPQARACGNPCDHSQHDPLGCQRSVGYQACARESVREGICTWVCSRHLTSMFVETGRAIPLGFPARFPTSPRLRGMCLEHQNPRSGCPSREIENEFLGSPIATVRHSPRSRLLRAAQSAALQEASAAPALRDSREPRTAPRCCPGRRS